MSFFTRDVSLYLKRAGIRDQIEEGVREAIGPHPTVVVSHSLGSVVAYNLLRREGGINRWNVPLFLTLGSPLAVKTVSDSLIPHKHPECVGRWFNARDPREIVAIRPLDASHGWDITPAIENYAGVQNGTDNRHGIEGYLSDPVVAKRIHDALCSSAAS